MERRHIRSRRLSGTSLVELLVVIVIFAVGILATLQIFPGGFKVLATTRSNTIAINLTRDLMDHIRGRRDRMPEMIVPVRYLFNTLTNTVVIEADPNLSPDELGPYTNRIDGDGDVLEDAALGNNKLGNWRYLSASNRFRRVIGEGGPVPAPRNIGSTVGSLMTLDFAPIVYNPQYSSLFSIYGRDFVVRAGVPNNLNAAPDPDREYEVFLQNADAGNATLYIARDDTQDREFRLAMSAWVDNGTTVVKRQIVDATIVVPATGTVGTFGYQAILLDSMAVTGTETFMGVDYGSVRLARKYRFLTAAQTFDGQDPYEYKLLQPELGLILLNPLGYNKKERRSGGWLPLLAKVNYDIYDWRIIRDEFRVPETMPAEQKLKLGNLTGVGRVGPDGKVFSGLPIAVPNESGGTENRGFVVLDLETGGIYSKNSILLDGVFGMVTFIDQDANASNGLQVGLVLPGDTSATTINAAGRNVRAFYQCNNEWAVQVMKAPDAYTETYTSPGIGQYYAGGSSTFFTGNPTPGESATRIYFAPMEAGNKVTVGEIWYNSPSGVQVLSNQDFLIQRPLAGDPIGLPYIDLLTYVPTATSMNYAQNGYAVRNIKGLSITVRVLWNPATFRLTADEATNLDNFEQWSRNWRKIESETFLSRGGN